MTSKTSKTEYPITIDNRGFLRWISTTAKALGIAQMPYLEIFIDPKGKRIGLLPGNRLKPGSFRMLDHQGRFLTYVRGAFHAAGLDVKPGAYTLVREGKVLVLGLGRARTTGPWTQFECRNSAGVPMLSLDRRGTLIMDRNCTALIDFSRNDSCEALWDKRRRSFVLTFGRKGALRVRTVATHANISFMGTLTSNGLGLPKEKLRMECQIDGKAKTLRFQLPAG